MTRERALPGRLAAVAAVIGLMVALAFAAPDPAAAQGSVDIDVQGTQVTVTVSSTPGYQARVELADDSIAATGLVDGAGLTTMVLELPTGNHEIEVIVFDPTGIPTSLGKFPVAVAGPPPDHR